VGGGAADVLPGRPRLRRRRLVGQLSLVYLQRPAHGMAMPLRRSALRPAARPALPNPRQRPSVNTRKAGLGDWPYKTVNDWAWQICHELWVGGDYNKIIDQLALGSTKRGDILALYGAAVGFTCNQPPGAPPGMPN
jgi:hypothetical protein